MPSLVLASDPSLQAVPTDPTAESRWQVDEPHLQAKVTPKPCWAVSGSCPEPQVGSAGWGHSTHLVADHHVDACGALAVHPVDVLWRDAVQVGDLLDQLQGGQLLQEDGVVHWRAEDRSFYRTSICFQSSPPTNSPPTPSNQELAQMDSGIWPYWGHLWKPQGPCVVQHQVKRCQTMFFIPVSVSPGEFV